MFGKKKQNISYDKETEEPAIRSSICTGEMTVGFKDKKSGKFRDIKRVSSKAEADLFFKDLGIDKELVKTIY